MGTKRRLAPHVAAIARLAPEGPFLDLFSGLCTVATQVGPTRPLWSNDSQLFAANVGAAVLTSSTLPMSSHRTAISVFPHYRQNGDALAKRWERDLAREKQILEKRHWRSLNSFYRQLPTVQSARALESERKALALSPMTPPYRLVSITFAGGYFGLTQSLQIDSIRYGIEHLYQHGAIDLEQRRWMCLALCVAAHRISTTTGHFAQYLEISRANSHKFFTQRLRSAWKEWLLAIEELQPIGTSISRKQNSAHHGDALDLLRNLKSAKKKPAVVYADPPYTKDQYSRYYHVLDTLLSYTYPDALSKGRYPSARFTSTFSLRSTVEKSIEALAEYVAELNARLILSYPADGLLPASQSTIRGILKQVFRHSRVRKPFPQEHSTFGASSGLATKTANELLFVAH